MWHVEEEGMKCMWERIEELSAYGREDGGGRKEGERDEAKESDSEWMCG